MTEKFKNTPLSISDKCQAILPCLNLICVSHFSITFSFFNFSKVWANMCQIKVSFIKCKILFVDGWYIYRF